MTEYQTNQLLKHHTKATKSSPGYLGVAGCPAVILAGQR